MLAQQLLLSEHESLSCSLNSSCCAEFDEAVCAAQPLRPTPAASPLGRGEEIIASAINGSEVEATSGGASDTASLTGTMGFSMCRDGNSSAPCAFYLGSIALSATSSLDVEVECPGGDESHTLSNLKIDLAQPAFGIDEEGTDEKGFPPGALTFIATFTEGGQPQVIVGHNEVPVFITAGGGNTATSDIHIEGQAACSGGGTGLVTGEFGLTMAITGQRVAEPPSITITTAASHTCGATMNLTANTSDPDSDIVSTRWYIDDVLMEDGTTSVEINADHELRAVVYDSRGAATTDTKSVTCSGS